MTSETLFSIVSGLSALIGLVGLVLVSPTVFPAEAVLRFLLNQQRLLQTVAVSLPNISPFARAAFPHLIHTLPLGKRWYDYPIFALINAPSFYIAWTMMSIPVDPTAHLWFNGADLGLGQRESDQAAAIGWKLGRFVLACAFLYLALSTTSQGLSRAILWVTYGPQGPGPDQDEIVIDAAQREAREQRMTRIGVALTAAGIILGFVTYLGDKYIH